MQSAAHFQRKAPSQSRFQIPPAPTEHRFQVFTSHVELVHPEFDGFNEIWRAYGVMLGFIGFDKCRKHV